MSIRLLPLVIVLEEQPGTPTIAPCLSVLIDLKKCPCPFDELLQTYSGN